MSIAATANELDKSGLPERLHVSLRGLVANVKFTLDLLPREFADLAQLMEHP